MEIQIENKTKKRNEIRKNLNQQILTDSKIHC